MAESNDELTSRANSPGRRFNWGAFFLTWIWALGNRSMNAITLALLLLCFLPYLGVVSAIALSFYYGLTGNSRAWRNRRWESVEHFTRIQKRWAVIGLVQFCVALFILVVLTQIYEK